MQKSLPWLSAKGQLRDGTPQSPHDHHLEDQSHSPSLALAEWRSLTPGAVLSIFSLVAKSKPMVQKGLGRVSSFLQKSYTLLQSSSEMPGAWGKKRADQEMPQPVVPKGVRPTTDPRVGGQRATPNSVWISMQYLKKNQALEWFGNLQ